MSYTTNDFRGEAHEAIGFVDAAGTELYEFIKNLFINWAQEHSIPATFSEDIFKSGSLFSATKLPIFIIQHPDPNCKYFKIGMYVIENTAFFQLLGKSAEMFKYNMKQGHEKEGHFIQAALTRPNEIKIEQELQWQASILRCLDEE